MTTTTNMNRKQQMAFNKIMEFATMHGHYEVKELKVEGNEFDHDLYVRLEVGMPNDEGTMAEVFCRSCYSFNLGHRGGIYFFDSNREYRKHYIEYYEIGKNDIYR